MWTLLVFLVLLLGPQAPTPTAAPTASRFVVRLAGEKVQAPEGGLDLVDDFRSGIPTVLDTVLVELAYGSPADRECPGAGLEARWCDAVTLKEYVESASGKLVVRLRIAARGEMADTARWRCGSDRKQSVTSPLAWDACFREAKGKFAKKLRDHVNHHLSDGPPS